MRKIPDISFDLDGVLIDIVPVLRDELLQLTGKDVGEAEKVCCYGFENHGITRPQLLEALVRVYPRYTQHLPIKGAHTLLKSLPHPIHVVTARGIEFARYTHEALRYHYPKIPFAVSFTGGHDNKAPYLKPHSIFVEDRGETAEYLTENNFITVFLLDKPYNQNFGKDNVQIFRIKDLYEIREYLDMNF